MVRLADLAEINPPRPAIHLSDEDEVSFIPMGDVGENGRWEQRQTRKLKDVRQGYTYFEEGDVLFAKITPCMENGKGCHAVGLKNGVGFGTTEFHVLRAREDSDARLLYHLSMDQAFRLRAEARMTGSAGQQRVPTSFLEAFEVECFTKQEQAAIAEVLTAADDAIARTEALIAKHRRVRTGLMQDLLTKGIDADGRIRSGVEAGAEYYRGWPVIPLGKLAEIASGVTLGKKLSGPGTIELPYLRVFNVQDGYVDLSDVKTIAVKEEHVQRYRLKPGDVLMNEGGDFDKLGRGTVWQGQINPCLHQNHVFRVRVEATRLLPEFLSFITSSPYGKQFFVLSSKQSTNLASINSTQLNAFPVPCPDLDEQQRIVDLLHDQRESIDRETAYLAKLRRLKIGLMQDLLTGRTSVEALLADTSTEAMKAAAS